MKNLLHSYSSYKSQTPTFPMMMTRNKIRTFRLYIEPILQATHRQALQPGARLQQQARPHEDHTFGQSVHNGFFLQPGTGHRDLQVQQQHETQKQWWYHVSDPQDKNGAQ